MIDEELWFARKEFPTRKKGKHVYRPLIAQSIIKYTESVRRSYANVW